MEALLASYADDSSDTGSDSDSNPTPPQPPSASTSLAPLPPPPISLLQPPNSLGNFLYHQTQKYLEDDLFSLNVCFFASEVPSDSLPSSQVNRVRSFPHIEGNYALHVYIPGNFFYLPCFIAFYASLSNFVYDSKSDLFVGNFIGRLL